MEKRTDQLEVRFLGATGTVTGSKFLLTYRGNRVVLDCCCASNKTQKGGVMKKFILPIIFAGAVGSLPVLAQEQKGMPMKEGMPMKGEGMKGGGMMMDKMKGMLGHMAEMRKGMGGMMKGKGMMKGEEMKGMGKSMG